MIFIGAAFRIERCLYLGHTRSQSTQHFRDDMVTPDADAVLKDLAWQMPVAELPGKHRQMAGIAAVDFVKLFRRSVHLNDPAIFQNQPVAMPEQSGISEIEQKGDAIVGQHLHAATVAVGLT